MDAKIYRRPTEKFVFSISKHWTAEYPMNKYELLTELKDVDKQKDYKENYDEIQGPLDCLYNIVPLQATDIVVLTNTTWEGTYFCGSFGWFVLNGDKFDIESDDLVSNIVIRNML